MNRTIGCLVVNSQGLITYRVSRDDANHLSGYQTGNHRILLNLFEFQHKIPLFTHLLPSKPSPFPELATFYKTLSLITGIFSCCDGLLSTGLAHNIPVIFGYHRARGLCRQIITGQQHDASQGGHSVNWAFDDSSPGVPPIADTPTVITPKPRYPRCP